MFSCREWYLFIIPDLKRLCAPNDLASSAYSLTSDYRTIIPPYLLTTGENLAVDLLGHGDPFMDLIVPDERHSLDENRRVFDELARFLHRQRGRRSKAPLVEACGFCLAFNSKTWTSSAVGKTVRST